LPLRNRFAADRFHTNKLGVYRAQLPFGTYTISARGEFQDGGTCSNASYKTQTKCESLSGTWTTTSLGYTLAAGSDTHTIDFDHQTSAITVKLTDGGTCSDGSDKTQSACEVASETWTVAGIGSITPKLRSVATGKTTGNPTMSDGTSTLYVPDGDYFFSVIVNNGSTNAASCNWDPARSACDSIKAKSIDLGCTKDQYTDETTCTDNNKGWSTINDAVSIIADDTTTFADIPMPTGTVISGTVKDNNGVTADAKVIALVKDTSTDTWEGMATVRTGADGIYTLTLPSASTDTYYLYAKSPNGFYVKYQGSNDMNGCPVDANTTNIVNFDFEGDTSNITMKVNGNRVCPSD